MKYTIKIILLLLFAFIVYVAGNMFMDYFNNGFKIIGIWLVVIIFTSSLIILIKLSKNVFKSDKTHLLIINLAFLLPLFFIAFYKITDKTHPMIRKYIMRNTNILQQSIDVKIYTDSIENTSISLYKTANYGYILMHDKSTFFKENISNMNWDVLYISPIENWVGLQNNTKHNYVKFENYLLQSDMGNQFIPIGFDIKSGHNVETNIKITDDIISFNMPKEAIYKSISIKTD